MGRKNVDMDALTVGTRLVHLPSLLIQSSTPAATVNGKQIYQSCWECEDHFALRLIYVSGNRVELTNMWVAAQRRTSDPDKQPVRVPRSTLAELTIAAMNRGKYRMHEVIEYHGGECWACAASPRKTLGKRFRNFFGNRDRYLGVEYGRPTETV